MIHLYYPKCVFFYRVRNLLYKNQAWKRLLECHMSLHLVNRKRQVLISHSSNVSQFSLFILNVIWESSSFTLLNNHLAPLSHITEPTPPPSFRSINGDNFKPARFNYARIKAKQKQISGHYFVVARLDDFHHLSIRPPIQECGCMYGLGFLTVILLRYIKVKLGPFLYFVIARLDDFQHLSIRPYRSVDVCMVLVFLRLLCYAILK